MIVKTQKEFNALKDFKEDTYVYIKSDPDEWIVIKTIPKYCYVVARESSHVEAWGSSHVVARESSHVEAWGSSHVEARESSHVVARESSHVEAYMNSSVKTYSKYVEIEKLKNYATLICIDEKCIVKNKSKTANIIIQPKVKYNKQLFKDIYKNNLINSKKIVLYKSVNPDTLYDFYLGKIKYEGEVFCPDWDTNFKDQCGHALHLSPTPDLALSYNQGKILKCEVELKDIVVHPDDITKVRCRKVKVINEE